jgi:hypothetical protein
MMFAGQRHLDNFCVLVDRNYSADVHSDVFPTTLRRCSRIWLDGRDVDATDYEGLFAALEVSFGTRTGNRPRLSVTARGP